MAMTKIGEIKLVVKFEDGTEKRMTVKEIAELKDKRRWEVIGPKGDVVMAKTFRGL